MSFECVMGHFEVTGKSGLCGDASLLEEHRDTPPHLYVAHHDITPSKDLFCLHVIGYVAQVIDSPGIVSGTGSLTTPPADQ